MPAMTLDLRPRRRAARLAGRSSATLHRGYPTAVGGPAATRLSELVLPLLLAPWVLRVEQRHPLPRLKDAVVVGAAWAGATVAFDFLLGHYVNGDSWQTLRAAYDLTEGRRWTINVLLVARSARPRPSMASARTPMSRHVDRDVGRKTPALPTRGAAVSRITVAVWLAPLRC